jgi:hypothetical protein
MHRDSSYYQHTRPHWEVYVCRVLGQRQPGRRIAAAALSHNETDGSSYAPKIRTLLQMRAEACGPPEKGSKGYSMMA